MDAVAAYHGNCLVHICSTSKSFISIPKQKHTQKSVEIVKKYAALGYSASVLFFYLIRQIAGRELWYGPVLVTIHGFGSRLYDGHSLEETFSSLWNLKQRNSEEVPQMHAAWLWPLRSDKLGSPFFKQFFPCGLRKYLCYTEQILGFRAEKSGVCTAPEILTNSPLTPLKGRLHRPPSCCTGGASSAGALLRNVVNVPFQGVAFDISRSELPLALSTFILSYCTSAVWRALGLFRTNGPSNH